MAKRVAVMALLLVAVAFECIAAGDPEEEMNAVKSQADRFVTMASLCVIVFLSSFGDVCIQTQMIRYHGYVAEEYNVTTRDGYILGLQRILCPRSAVGNDSECKRHDFIWRVALGILRERIMLVRSWYQSKRTFLARPYVFSSLLRLQSRLRIATYALGFAGGIPTIQ